jgi:hypothetical protein
MRVKPFTFSGYPSGNVDFAARYAAADDDTRSAGRAVFSPATASGLDQPTASTRGLEP